MGGNLDRKHAPEPRNQILWEGYTRFATTAQFQERLVRL